MIAKQVLQVLQKLFIALDAARRTFRAVSAARLPKKGTGDAIDVNGDTAERGRGLSRPGSGRTARGETAEQRDQLARRDRRDRLEVGRVENAGDRHLLRMGIDGEDIRSVRCDQCAGEGMYVRILAPATMRVGPARPA